ncbi:RNA polymerase sigma factor [Nonomuraea sp. AD125B]|uniref:RNA polymerase sigma factor n=1 Tax=Nonomuraea sp. AD125B TaxID=3242897 RepID=UPI003529BFE0
MTPLEIGSAREWEARAHSLLEKLSPAQRKELRARAAAVAEASNRWAVVMFGALGNERTFAAFYAEAFPQLRQYLQGLGALRDEAEDLAQEALLAVYKHRQGIDHPTAYAITAARNLFFALRKREALKLRQAPTAPSCHGDLATRHDGADEQMVREAIAALPPQQRRVLALRYDGYTPAEIATLLGTNPNNVRVTLHHARKKLRGAARERLAAA